MIFVFIGIFSAIIAGICGFNATDWQWWVISLAIIIPCNTAVHAIKD